jgi:hypothetical protein
VEPAGGHAPLDVLGAAQLLLDAKRRPDEVGKEGRSVLLEDGKVTPAPVEHVRGDLPGDEPFPEPFHHFDPEEVGVRAGGVEGEDHTALLRNHHGLDDDGHGRVVGAESLDLPVGAGPGGPQRGPAQPHRPLQVVGTDSEEAAVLAGEGGGGEILGRGRGPHCHSGPGGGVAVGGRDGVGQHRRQRGPEEGGLDLRGVFGQAGQLDTAREGRQPGPEAGLGHEDPVGLHGQGGGGGDGGAVLDQAVEGRRLAADQ